jgi:hypothetical protein
MALQSTTNIHRVKAIRVRATVFETFVSHEFTFKTEDGGEITVSGFASSVLTIEGADHVNHVASGETKPVTVGVFEEVA